MTTDFRALCAELVRAWDVTSDFDYNDFGNSVKSIVNRARAALAEEPAVPLSIADAIATAGSEYLFLLTGKTDQLLTPDLIENLYSQFHSIIAGLADNLSRVDEPAVPEGREPASVTGQFMPTDAELLCIAAEEIDGYGNGINPGDYEPSTEMAVEAYGSELCAYARAVLARWGNPAPAPPAEGEVEELVAWLRSNALTVKKASGNPANGARQRMNRAADLLQRLSPPQPVPVSERPWEREGWCDDQGRCWTGRPLPDAPDRWDWSSAVTDGNVTHCLPHDIPVLPAMISIEDIAAQKALVPVSERLPGQGVEG